MQVVHPHASRLGYRADALSEKITPVPEHPQRLQRNFNHALQGFGEVELCSRYSLPKIRFSKDLLVLVLNKKILVL